MSGDEALLVGEAADAIRARVKRAGSTSAKCIFIERVADWEAVRAASNNLSLFGSRKLIEIRLPSGKPGVGGGNAIVDLLANASPDNVYLMLTGKLEREQNNSAWVKAFEIRRRLARRVARRARATAAMAARARRRRSSSRSTTTPCDSSSSAPKAICSPRSRSSRSSGWAPRRGNGKRVDLAAVQASIGDSARFDVFQLGEAALGADVPRALRILAGLRSEGVEPTLALWSIAREIHNVWGTTQQGPSRGWQKPSAALENAKRRAAKIAVCAARGAHLARRSHDQGPASRRRVG